MTLERAIEILEAYQDFCTKINHGGDGPHIPKYTPYEFNEAIDTVVSFHNNFASEFEEKLGFTE